MIVWVVIAAIVKGIAIIFALLTLFAYMTFIERRVVARIQRRIGPNRAGPFGLLQPLADALKMAFKEQIIPLQARVGIYLLAPCISIVVALSAFAVVPLSREWGSTNPWNPWIADINVGILYIFAISSLAVYGIVLGGWSSGNRYSLLGALRSAAQMVSYEVSIGLAIMGVLMFSGQLSLVAIVHAQYNQNIWFIAAQPLGFVLYFIAAVAEVNRAPFDLPEAEQELVAGYLTEFSGLRWSLYQMAEYINMITVSSVAATLFLGGWNFIPLGWFPAFNSWISGAPFVWYILKLALFLFCFIWLRATLPRIRYDQLMRLGWLVMLPLAVLNLIFTAIVVALGWPWWASGIFGAVVLLLVGGGIANIYLRRQVLQVKAPPVAKEGFPLPASVRLVSTISGIPIITQPVQAQPAPSAALAPTETEDRRSPAPAEHR
jgi:NADH-quinone oxidoreductase subunit H